jgi:hypothetical protein
MVAKNVKEFFFFFWAFEFCIMDNSHFSYITKMEIKNTHYHHHLDYNVGIDKIFTFSVYLILLLQQSGPGGFDSPGQGTIIQYGQYAVVTSIEMRAE